MKKPRKSCGALSGRQDLNLRPPGPKPGALPPAPLPDSDLDIFKPSLRPRKYFNNFKCVSNFSIRLSSYGFDELKQIENSVFFPSFSQKKSTIVLILTENCYIVG